MLRTTAAASICRRLAGCGAISANTCAGSSRSATAAWPSLQRSPVASSLASSLASPLATSSSMLIATDNSQRCMASFSMAQLKELRGLSGAPIVECKKALGETDGDVKGAMDWLRQHGAAKASQKVSGRTASEGLVSILVADDAKSASLVHVQSETDFASRSASFVDLVQHVANATLRYDAAHADAIALTEDQIKEASHNDKTVQTALEEAIVAIRENLGLANNTQWNVKDANAVLVGYVHGRVDGSQAGSAAALVELTTTDDAMELSVKQDIGKKLAMHIVAAKPEYLDAESVPSHIVDGERNILKSQLEDSNKPPQVMDKIVNGRLRKFYESVCLIEQEHLVEEGNPKVKAVAKDNNVQINRFALISI